MSSHPHLLDVVALRSQCGQWLPGTSGTIVHAFPDAALVEVADSDGQTLDMLTVPYAGLEVIDSYAAIKRRARQKRLAS